MHSFENRRVSISEFSSCVDIGNGCGRDLQNDSYGDFQHSKQCKYKENKFSNVTRENKPEAKMTTDVISGRHVGAHVHKHGATNHKFDHVQITRVWYTAQT